ncbi:MAG: glycosyltransferase [Proteobacteria bacterium]|nr:glycosyltransferase [Pseudomonadota bacterium]MBU2518319.1 glycosyltransferase [Pseudomonadota bacterium]
MSAPPPQPRRVLRLIARLNVGGPARHVAWLMQEMDPGLYSQTLAAGRVQKGEDDLGPELRAQGLTWRDLPRLGRSISPINDTLSLLAVLGLLVKLKPHILATEASKAGLLGRSAALLYRPLAALAGWPRLRCVHTYHGHTFHSYFGPTKARLFLALERSLARWVTWRIVTISPRQYREIAQTYRVGRPGQAVVVPLGIDLEPFAEPQAGRRRFRAELGVGDGEFLVGAVGRVAPVKNYGLFLQTAAALGQDSPELFARCRFVLIGGGSQAQMEALRAQAENLGLGGRVSFLGSRSDREAFFPGLDALLLTSNNEGTPVAILEGGACGLPMVATEVGGVPDLLGAAQENLGGGMTRRQRGLGAPAGDARALARGLALLLNDRGEAARLGEALKRYVWQNHAKSRLAADFERLYGQMESRG